MTAAPPWTAGSCRLRPAARGDAALLFEWVNRPDSLAASLVTRGPVAWDEHCRWLDERLADPASRLWIVEQGGRAVGQVRFQDRGGGPEIAIYLEAHARGRGVGPAALALALRQARGIWAGARAVAKVRFDNLVSRRLFEAAGFRETETAADHWILEKSIRP